MGQAPVALPLPALRALDVDRPLPTNRPSAATTERPRKRLADIINIEGGLIAVVAAEFGVG